MWFLYIYISFIIHAHLVYSLAAKLPASLSFYMKQLIISDIYPFKFYSVWILRIWTDFLQICKQLSYVNLRMYKFFHSFVLIVFISKLSDRILNLFEEMSRIDWLSTLRCFYALLCCVCRRQAGAVLYFQRVRRIGEVLHRIVISALMDLFNTSVYLYYR